MEAQHRADPFARYRTVGTAAALLILLLGAKEMWQNFANPGCRDFVSFWGAAKFAITGTPALAYNAGTLSQLQNAVASCGHGNGMPFPYMPAFLLLVIPFGFVSFPLAMALWITATLVLYLLWARRLMPRSGLLALAFPPILVTIAIGQNGFLTAALFMAAMSNIERRPFAAGLVAGCLILKPQLGLFLPIAFVASRQWRTIAGAALSSIGLALLGLLLFGPATFLAWAEQLRLYGAIARDGLVGWSELTSVYAAARQAGLDAAPAIMLHTLVALAAAALVWKTWRSSQDRFARAAILSSATALASPYLFLYDLPILIVPVLWLARTRTHPALLALPWCISAAAIAQHFGGAGLVNLNPLIAISLLALTARPLELSAEPPPMAHDAPVPA